MEWSEMPIAEEWRAGYRENRYLEHKTMEHVAARMRYLAECVLQLSSKGTIIPETKSQLTSWLWARITHTMYECELRSEAWPDGFMAGANVPRSTSNGIAPEQVCYDSRKRTEPGEVFRFGNRQWLNRSLCYGEFRICPASKYKELDLNDAIRDDELSFVAYSRFPNDLRQAQNFYALPSLMSDGGVRLSAISDYYVLCVSMRYSLRMYADFKADSCLIIYDAKEFGRRLICKIKDVLPEWIIGSLPVKYVDPDDPKDGPFHIPQVKHMKYAYQMEERVIAHPKKPQASFDELYVTIGSIEDIAEVITLRQTT